MHDAPRKCRWPPEAVARGHREYHRYRGRGDVCPNLARVAASFPASPEPSARNPATNKCGDRRGRRGIEGKDECQESPILMKPATPTPGLPNHLRELAAP